jgi:hypothetical protein
VADDEARKTQDALLRAELAGLPVRPEHVAALVEGWALIEPHLAAVMAAALAATSEPAPLFRP